MRYLFSFFFLLSFSFSSVGQNPDLFKYQAAVRDAGGTIIANQGINYKVSILQSSSTGTSVYSESHFLTTNGSGMVNFVIGSGNNKTGNIATIPWEMDSFFIKSEIDPLGGGNFINLATERFLALPYSKYANLVDGVTTQSELREIGVEARVNALSNAVHLSGSWIGHFKIDESKLSVEMFEPILIEVGRYQNITFGFRLQKLWPPYHHNISFGVRALDFNDSTAYNIAFGDNPMDGIFGSGIDENIAFGSQTLYSENDVKNNVAIGRRAIADARDFSTDNIGIGPETLGRCIDTACVAVGSKSQQYTRGMRNVSLGAKALDRGFTDSHNNTAIGFGAGEQANRSEFNCYIGKGTGYQTINKLNAIALGNVTQVSGSNSATIGNTSMTSIGGYSAWSNLSDGNFKKNVKENVVGLDFLMDLRPVTYSLDIEKLAESNGENAMYDNGGEMPEHILDSRAEGSKIIRTGFIAQEVEATAKSSYYDFNGIDKPSNADDHYALRYASFVVPLVKSIQEQQTLIEAQLKQIEVLQKRIKFLKERVK